MQQSLRLGTFKGIPIGIHSTWLIAFGLITVSLVYYYSQQYPHWSVGTNVTIGVLTSVLFFISVIGHELAHSLVALAKGIPVRSITLFVFGGISQISREAATAAAEFQIAIVGPLSSLVIGGLFWFLSAVAGNVNQPLAEAFRWLAWINVLLALFNLIPGFPLDGGRVLRSILWWRKGDFNSATRTAANIGKLISYGFIFLGIWEVFQGFLINGLWIAFIGWFLLNAAQANVAQLTLRDALAGIVAANLMSRECPTVPPYISLTDFVHDYLLRTGRRCYVVTEGSRVFGLITPREVSAVPRTEWHTTSVAAAMTPFEKLKWVRPDESAINVMEKMNAENINQLPVIEDGRLLGIISRETLLNQIQLYMTLYEQREV
ncbi:MAG: site-2 protease family protein [Acidobacteria bacterium]|nr:MAG: site-2 protease family protein [Acidobacteriota bacterium]